MRSIKHTRAVIYVRLSRDDEREDSEPTEEKLRKRLVSARELAEKHELFVAEEDIFVERVSGTKLYTEYADGTRNAARPGACRIVEMARAGEITHILTPFQDRFLKGSKSDEAFIQRALTLGRVKFISLESVMDFGDPDFDPTMYEFSALTSRIEIRKYKARRKETNRVRFREGKRSGSAAPYGYRWRKAVYEDRVQTVTPHYEIREDEYAVVCEIFRRIRTEGIPTIIADLNTRLRATGQPQPPGVRRNLARAIPFWNYNSIHSMIHNPHYAGYPAHRVTVGQEGNRIELTKDQWILADQEQDYLHPVTLAEMEEIYFLIRQRCNPGRSPIGTPRLLSGLLYCPAGKPMWASGDGNYGCQCKSTGNPHPNQYIRQTVIEAAIFDYMARALADLPAELFPTSQPSTSRSTISREFNTLTQQAATLREDIHDLMQHRAAHVRRYGETLYEQSCARARAELEQAETRLSVLRAALDEPEPQDIAPLLSALTAQDFRQLFYDSPLPEQRRMVRLIVQRIHMIAPTPAVKWSHFRHAEVCPHAWIARFEMDTRLDLRAVTPHHNAKKRPGKP